MNNLKRKLFLISLLTALSIGLIACSSENTASGEGAFYENGDIEMLVPFGAGGGTDVFARFVGPYYTEFVEGEPTVQVLNVAGGGSITGTNEFYNMKEANGYNLLATSASTHTPYLLKQKGVQYDLAGLKPIIGFPTGGVVYTKPELQDDILNPSEELVYAGISATGLDLVTLLSFEVLGLDVKSVLGYEGRGPSRVAFEQGESNIDYQTSSAYNTNVEPLIEEGTAAPLYSFGQLEKGDLKRDPAYPDLPSLKEFYVDIHGTEPSGPAWEAYKAFVGSSFTVQKVIWVHEDAPQEGIDALIDSSEKMIKDEAFNEKGEEILGGYEPYVRDELDEVVNDSLIEVSTDTIDWVKDFLENNHGVNLE